ncbi:hypothetical protein ACQKWADRAFT_324325 [Trichoderma austrokoningii]
MPSQSTENLLLKCQKETRKQCLPPEWSALPPNKEILPPPDTLALAIQIEASFALTSRIDFLEAASNRSVGSIAGAEYRGSIVVVPWRPGLKFVCVVASGRRRGGGCRVGVVREAKGVAMMRMKKDAVVVVAAGGSSSSRNISGNDVDNTRCVSTIGSSPRSRIPTLKGQRMSIKKYENRHVSLNAAKTIGNKSRIPTRRVEQVC